MFIENKASRNDRVWISLFIFSGHSIIFWNTLDKDLINQQNRSFSTMKHDHYQRYTEVYIKL